MDTKRKRRIPATGGRYDMRDVSRRIERLRLDRGLSVAQICAKLGRDYERWDWSRKVRGETSEFTVGEIGLIADILEAPTGWPFLDPVAGSAIDALMGRGKR